MAEYYSYVESSGLILPDTEALKTAVENEFRNAFGQDISVAPETPQGVLIAAETEARDNVVRNNAEVANQLNPDLAGGVFLDAIAALTGLGRRAGQPTLVRAVLSGVPGTAVTAGAEAATEAGDVFRNLATAHIGPEGHAEAWFRSAEEGAVLAPAHSLTVINTPILGWEGVTNPEAGVTGWEEETDVVFRKRREDTLFLQGVALPGAICSGIMDVDGVRSMLFRENYEAVPQVIDNVTIPPHTIYVVVDGGEDQDVADMLFTKKSLGCGMLGDVEVDVVCPESGQVYVARFNRPEDVPIRVRATVRVLNNSTVDCESVVRQAIVDYADNKLVGMRGFAVGAAVSPFEMSAAVNLVEPSIFVITMAVGLLTDAAADLKSETMHLEVWQRASVTLGSIEVVRG